MADDPAAVDPAPGPGAAGSTGSGRSTDDPGMRGRLEVSDRAIKRIATTAVKEVDGVAPGGSGGALSGLLGSGYPAAEVEHAGSRVRVELDVALLWPWPAAEVAGDVRRVVSRRLEQYAGVQVDSVVVTVRDVVRPGAATRGTRDEARVR